MDKYEFKRYLLEQLPDARQDELIFWKKKIPMPVDLVYKMFDDRAEILGLYADHFLSAYAYGRHISESVNWQATFEIQPTSQNLTTTDQLRQVFRKASGDDLFTLLREVNDLLMIPEHTFGEDRFLNAMCHEGRKYKRLYLPLRLKDALRTRMPALLDLVGISNGDMFSNIVADVLGVYRMGFADAFSVMFNKLIDYTIENSLAGSKDFSRETRIRVVQESGGSESINLQYGQVHDGSLFEPYYHSSKTSVRLNEKHPFVLEALNKGSAAKAILEQLTYEMARIENEAVKENVKNVLEVFRHDFSRNLRIRIEDQTLAT